jgi:hypothetical protein
LRNLTGFAVVLDVEREPVRVALLVVGGRPVVVRPARQLEVVLDQHPVVEHGERGRLHHPPSSPNRGAVNTTS